MGAMSAGRVFGLLRFAQGVGRRRRHSSERKICSENLFRNFLNCSDSAIWPIAVTISGAIPHPNQ